MLSRINTYGSSTVPYLIHNLTNHKRGSVNFDECLDEFIFSSFLQNGECNQFFIFHHGFWRKRCTFIGKSLWNTIQRRMRTKEFTHDDISASGDRVWKSCFKYFLCYLWHSKVSFDYKWAESKQVVNTNCFFFHTNSRPGNRLSTAYTGLLTRNLCMWSKFSAQVVWLRLCGPDMKQLLVTDRITPVTANTWKPKFKRNTKILLFSSVTGQIR